MTSSSQYERPPSDLITAYEALPKNDVAGTVARALDVLGVVGTIPATSLQAVLAGRTLIGPAFTIRNIPERSIPYRKWAAGRPSAMGEREAFLDAQPGDVVVIDGMTVFPASCLGSMAISMAGKLGIAGAIVSGAVTGVPGIRAAGCPVWARAGTTLTGHHRLETVEINGPIGIDCVRIEPGDLIVADDSGVTVVPLGMAADVLEVIDRMRQSGQSMRALLQGEPQRDALRQALEEFITTHAAVGKANR